jgi:hypothetical protein
MSISSPKSPKWGRLFSVAVVLVLVGGAVLLIYAISKRNSPTSSSQNDSAFYTQAANTLAALQTASTATSPLLTDTPTGLLTATGSPQFGLTPTSTYTPYSTAVQLPVSTVNTCNNSSYVSDVTIPDNTVIAPGASFVKTWALQNTGTCAWDTSYKMIFVSGNLMGGASTNIPQSVAPSQQVQVSVSLTAPVTAGTYTGYWRLADGQGQGFGGAVTVVIVVSTSTTVTPTGTLATSTSTPTKTKTPVATSPATATPVPTTAVPPTAVPTTAVPPTDADTPTTPTP